jgi:nucleotide-binding universal stress UspA family protein
MRLTHSGALVVIFSSTNPDSIKQEAQRLEKIGLKRGVHFSVKMPEEGRYGYVSILKEGLAYAAFLSVYGKDEQQRRLAAEFVEYILKRAEKAGKDVYRKAEEIVEEGMSRGSQKLERFEKTVEVNGKTYVVKVIGGEAVEEKQNGKTLLRIKITAEVDGVRSEYTITYSRRGADNVVKGSATARADAPGGREADAERLAAVIKALTGKEPRIRRRSDGKIEIECGRAHLDGFVRFAELAEAIMKWLMETSR